MKKILPLLLLASSCGTIQGVATIPPFVIEKVCAPEAVSYFQNKKDAQALTALLANDLNERIYELNAPLKRCHEQEVYRTDNLDPFNLCYVVGTDPNGRIEISNFHTDETKLTKEFYQCLNEAAAKLDLSKFKNIVQIQSYKVYFERR